MHKKKIWFTSDTHFDHKRICEHSRRPFKTPEEMNEELIERWNSRVALSDDVYHLGDFSFAHQPERWEEIRERLNGRIHLIRGNHDHRSRMKKVKHLFEWVKEYEVLKVKQEDDTKQVIVLFHYKIYDWDRMADGAWHLFGHHHFHNWKESAHGKSFDVGVDANDFYPISFEEVRDRMRTLNKLTHNHDIEGMTVWN